MRSPAEATRLIGGMLRSGFEAAPRLMWAITGLTLVSGVSASLYPYGFMLLTDGLGERDATAAWWGAILTGGLIAVNWASAMFDANLGFELVDRTTLLVSTRVAEMVNRVTVIDHLERPDVASDLDLVEQNRGVLGSAPRTVLTALQAVARGAVLVVLLWSVRPVLALLPLFAAAPLLAEARAEKVRDRADLELTEARRLRDELFETTLSATAGGELRVWGLADDLVARHAEVTGRIVRATARAALVAAVVAASGWAVFLVGFAGAVSVTVRAAAAGEVTPGQVVLMVMLAQQARQVMDVVTDSFRDLLTSARTIERINRVGERMSVRSGGSVVPPAALAHGISLQGVCFHYPGAAADALDDVDLHLPAGSTVAVVGENGAGKSTLVKVLTGMYRPTSGTVLVDGAALTTVDVARWRERTAATFQDFVRFELAAREVVGVGDLPRVDDDAAVMTALDRAGATRVVDALPEGLGTPLGGSFPAGAELSDGQWQQLAVGRGMMREAPLLVVLDEPAASLDAETEHRLFERYRDRARAVAAAVGGITLVVTHRFSTIAAADLIVVLAEGRVAESGNHAALMAAGGTYAELFTLQADRYA